MSASEYNFKIEQGSTFKIRFYYKDENGDPIDLTGYCARLTWKTNFGVVQSFSLKTQIIVYINLNWTKPTEVWF